MSGEWKRDNENLGGCGREISTLFLPLVWPHGIIGHLGETFEIVPSRLVNDKLLSIRSIDLSDKFSSVNFL
jgi:hypothetical protein